MTDDLAEKFFDEKIAPTLREKGIDDARTEKVRTQFIKDVIAAREELRGMRPQAPSGAMTKADADAFIQTVAAKQADEDLAVRYFDEWILPGIEELPKDGIEHLRTRYVVDALADKATMQQLRDIYG